MDFQFSDRVKDLQDKVTKFMDDHVYPNEERFHREVDEGDRWQPTKVIEELKEKAKAQGLWNLFLPESERGAGLKNHEYATLCEIMGRVHRSEEHTSELQSLMRISYAVFCLKKKINIQKNTKRTSITTRRTTQ